MVNAFLLRERMKEERYNVRTISRELGLSEGAMHSKLGGKTDFKAGEIVTLRKLLGLSDEEVIRIFLAQM